MISIAVLAHNSRDLLAECLGSLLTATAALQMGPGDVEWILVDDCSDADFGVPRTYRSFRAATTAPVRAMRFAQHRHYAYGVSAALSVARGREVLFVSHDMHVPPACLKTLLQLSAFRGGAGGSIIRPVSQHMDWAPACQVKPPLPPRTTDDVNRFGQLMSQRFGLAVSDYPILIGDAMLIDRRVIEKIGVFDSRFFGFWSDIDYGLRAQRAGFKLQVASGAWLHHAGSGFRREVVKARGAGAEEAVANQIVGDATRAYALFREKWKMQLAEDMTAVLAEDIASQGAAATGVREYEPPLAADPAVWQEL